MMSRTGDKQLTMRVNGAVRRALALFITETKSAGLQIALIYGHQIKADTPCPSTDANVWQSQVLNVNCSTEA